MPLDGSNNYYYPLGTPGVPNQTIESGKYNTFLDDLVMNDLNVPRPVSRGGTGASTPEQARTNLGVMSSAGGTMTGSIVVTGNIAAGDGIIYLGTDGLHYLQWDGTTYTLANGPLVVGGNTTIYGGLGVNENIGANGYLIVGGTSNTGVVRFGHASANYLYFDGTQYTLAGGPLTIGGGLTAGATTLGTLAATTTNLGATTIASLASSGSGWFGYDVTINRAEIGVPTQGYLFLGNTGGIYFGYDGTNLVAVGAPFRSSSDIRAAGTLIAEGGLVALNSTSTRFLQWNGSNYVLPNAHLYVNSSAVWTDAYNGVAGYLPLGGGTLAGNLAVQGTLKTRTSANQGQLWFGDGGQNLNFNTTNADGFRFQGGSSFHVDGSAWKPGGGSWDPTASDLRVKNVLGEYSHGLEQIKRLKPQRYKFKGNDGDTHKQVLDKEFIGLIAQDVETVMPEMVIKAKGRIDDKEVDDLRRLDTNGLIYALINSVRELATRVEELEGAG